jgi:hypothetical protein
MNSDCGSGEFVPPLRGVSYFGEVDPGFRLRFILSPRHAKAARAGDPNLGYFRLLATDEFFSRG